MKRSIAVLASLALFVAVSCKKTTTTKPPTVIPNGVNLNGSVNLYDDKGNAQSDKSGVLVSIHSRTNDSSFTATTDASGAYSFVSKNYGVYDIQFEKSGYGTYKVEGFTHYYVQATPWNPNVVPTANMGTLSTTAITGLSYVDNTYNGGPGMSYTLTVSPDPNTNSRAYFRGFLSTDPNVSSTNFSAYSVVKSIISNNATGGFTRDELITSYGFSTGQTVYLKVYGESVQSNDYFDEKSGKRVFPNLNATTVPAISFIVP
jgi:Carboxypeptidase regulatory-like domain